MFVRRMLAAGALLPLLLTGCQEAEGKQEPKLPPEPTSSASPKAEVPEKETAKQFIRRWIQAANTIQTTGEVDEYLALAPDCSPCQEFAENVQDVYRAGGHAEFAGAEIQKIRKLGDSPPTYDVTQYVPETRIHHGDSGRVETLPAGTTTMRATLQRTHGRWVLLDFAILR